MLGRPFPAQQPLADLLVRDEGEGGVAVLRQAGVQVNDPADPLRAAIGGTQHRVDGVVVADQHQLRRVEVVDQLHHILDVRLQVGARPGQVAALPEAGEGQRVHLRP